MPPEPSPPPGSPVADGERTILALDDRLPLTCTRSGTCCHGKQVWINPWELACLAAASGLAPRVCRDRHVVSGGVRIRFGGAPGWRNLPACDFYDVGSGCRAHGGRPLACRLYPLGRERQADEVRYLHQGAVFPCLDGCPAVTSLPTLSVRDYLSGQNASGGESAQDAYLEVMQDLADGAFVLLLDSGLAQRGDTATLRGWRRLASMADDVLPRHIEASWLDLLTIPELEATPDNSMHFIPRHRELLQQRAQRSFASLTKDEALGDASCLMMALALHLGRSLGCSTAELVQRWIAIAIQHGARDV